MVAISKYPRTYWAAKEDKPREKLAKTGPWSLTDVELLAILLGTGTATEHVMEVAQKMLDAAANDISRLAGMPIPELMAIHGIGHARAVRIKAVLEFARRAQVANLRRDVKILTSQDAFNILVSNLGDIPHEEFWIVFLNRRSKLIDKSRVSQGGLASTVADPRIIYAQALNAKASSIIVAHNHPSGNLNPSQADIDITKKISEAGKLLDIQLVDHLIISGNNYCSFADSGLL